MVANFPVGLLKKVLGKFSNSGSTSPKCSLKKSVINLGLENALKDIFPSKDTIIVR